MSGLLCTPLRLEQATLAGLRPQRTGRGVHRSAAAASRLSEVGGVLVAGLAGGLAPQVRPGHVVVGSEVRVAGQVLPVPTSELLAGALRRLGLTVHVGPLVTEARVVTGTRRRQLAKTGALAVDTESGHLVAPGKPFSAVRVVVDTEDQPLLSLGTATRGVRALRALRATSPALQAWCAAVGERDVAFATPASNRQQGVRAVSGRADLVLVLGFASSSSSRRLVEAAEREGVPVHLVDDVSQVELAWLVGARRLVLTAGAPAPGHLMDAVVGALGGLGALTVREGPGRADAVRFPFPREVS